MIISENDPWLNFEDAHNWQKLGKLDLNLGQVGHINVASGFGFPEIYDLHFLRKCAKSVILMTTSFI
jgi:predicted alpha/beta hydrolase family esterase